MNLPPEIIARQKALETLSEQKYLSAELRLAVYDFVKTLGLKDYTFFPPKNNRPSKSDIPGYWLICTPEASDIDFNGVSFGYFKDGSHEISNTLKSLVENDDQAREIVTSELGRFVSRRIVNDGYSIFSAFEVRQSQSSGNTTVNLFLPKTMPEVIAEMAENLNDLALRKGDEPTEFTRFAGKKENNIKAAKKLGINALYHVGVTLKNL